MIVTKDDLIEALAGPDFFNGEYRILASGSRAANYDIIKSMGKIELLVEGKPNLGYEVQFVIVGKENKHYVLTFTDNNKYWDCDIDDYFDDENLPYMRGAYFDQNIVLTIETLQYLLSHPSTFVFENNHFLNDEIRDFVRKL